MQRIRRVLQRPEIIERSRSSSRERHSSHEFDFFIADITAGRVILEEVGKPRLEVRPPRSCGPPRGDRCQAGWGNRP